MSAQGRRRLTEQAAAAHAAKVRRRVLIGVALALLLAGAAVLAYLQFGGGALQRAAEEAEMRTARVRFTVEGGAPGESSSFSGEYATTGDNERFTGEGTVTLDDEGAQPASVRKVGGRVWVRTERPDARPGRPWVRLDEDDAPWAPANLIALLRRLERVRVEGRETAAGRRGPVHGEAAALGAARRRGR